MPEMLQKSDFYSKISLKRLNRDRQKIVISNVFDFYNFYEFRFLKIAEVRNDEIENLNVFDFYDLYEFRLATIVEVRIDEIEIDEEMFLLSMSFYEKRNFYSPPFQMNRIEIDSIMSKNIIAFDL